MPAGDEFELINRFFDKDQYRADDVLCGIGDDAAVLQLTAGAQLVSACDTLVEGVHFPAGFAADSLAQRALATNLSDFAAMGATPRWLLLALTLPAADQAWLERFASRLATLALAHELVLVGGDTTRGPLTVTLTVLGSAHNGQLLRRSGARAGDDLWVSGQLGAAAAGLNLLQQSAADFAPPASQARELIDAFVNPVPRLALGQRLLSLASAAIDVSDGLLADAGHIAKASGVAIQIEGDALPAPASLQGATAPTDARRWIISGGDDYELLFTAAPEQRLAIEELAAELEITCTRIGTIQPGSGVVLKGKGWDSLNASGYNHFAVEN